MQVSDRLGMCVAAFSTTRWPVAKSTKWYFLCVADPHTQSTDYEELKEASATLSDATVYRHSGAASHHFLNYNLSLASHTWHHLLGFMGFMVDLHSSSHFIHNTLYFFTRDLQKSTQEGINLKSEWNKWQEKSSACVLLAGIPIDPYKRGSSKGIRTRTK